MSVTNDLIKKLVKELKKYAKSMFDTDVPELYEYIKSFVTQNTSDIERWLSLVTEGKLTRDDFYWLMKGKRDLLELEFLRLGGYILVDAEIARNEVIRIITKSALSLIF
jgi:hypothetical protein